MTFIILNNIVNNIDIYIKWFYSAISYARCSLVADEMLSSITWFVWKILEIGSAAYAEQSKNCPAATTNIYLNFIRLKVILSPVNVFAYE